MGTQVGSGALKEITGMLGGISFFLLVNCVKDQSSLSSQRTSS